MEHKIAGKRQVRMIKDLKSHLKKEAKSKELLEEKLKSTTNVLARLQEEMANSVPVVAPQQQSEKSEASRRPSRLAAMISQTVSGASTPTSTTSDSTKTFELSKPAADDGVKKLLAMRLESLLEENVRIKEKVSMLESIVQELTEELNVAREENALGLNNKQDEDVISGDIDGDEVNIDEDDVESFDI